MIKRIFLLFVLLSLSACVTNHAPRLTEDGSLTHNKGLILLSAGRGKSNGLLPLPFVSYGIYKRDSTDQKKVTFLPGEAGLINQLGKDKYGYIHIRELDKGRYYLIGQKGRGNAALFGLIGGMIHFDSDGKSTGVVIEFEVDEGKINYLGEVLTVKKPLGPDSFSITDQFDRDFETAKKQFPSLAKIQVVKNMAKKADQVSLD